MVIALLCAKQVDRAPVLACEGSRAGNTNKNYPCAYPLKPSFANFLRPSLAQRRVDPSLPLRDRAPVLCSATLGRPCEATRKHVHGSGRFTSTKQLLVPKKDSNRQKTQAG